MAILKGIKITDSEEVHQIDYEDAVANKPFGTTKEVLFEWDGNVDGLECWEMAANGETMPFFYKINNNTPRKESFVGATALCMEDGTEETLEITEEDVTDGLDGITGTEEKCFMVVGVNLVVLEEINIKANDELPYSINFTPGTWHASPVLMEGVYIKQIVRNTVKTIDEKYIPESLKVSEVQKVPDMTDVESGAFLRVIDGIATWQQLTNVSEVGA